MKITMLSTQRGSRDGIFVESFEKGQTYDLGATERSRDLAAVFVREGWATGAGGKAAKGGADGDGGGTDTGGQGAHASDGLTVAELKAALEAKGIAFDAAAKKADLQALLDAAA